MSPASKPRIVVVTGLSGSGKSTATRALEDIGYFCIDNLPVVLLPKMTELAVAAGAEIHRLALVVDAREGRFLSDAPRFIDEARRAGNPVEVVFLDASDEVLIRRFSETRRRQLGQLGQEHHREVVDAEVAQVLQGPCGRGLA